MSLFEKLGSSIKVVAVLSYAVLLGLLSLGVVSNPTSTLAERMKGGALCFGFTAMCLGMGLFLLFEFIGKSHYYRWKQLDENDGRREVYDRRMKRASKGVFASLVIMAMGMVPAYGMILYAIVFFQPNGW